MIFTHPALYRDLSQITQVIGSRKLANRHELDPSGWRGLTSWARVGFLIDVLIVRSLDFTCISYLLFLCSIWCALIRFTRSHSSAHRLDGPKLSEERMERRSNENFRTRIKRIIPKGEPTFYFQSPLSCHVSPPLLLRSRKPLATSFAPLASLEALERYSTRWPECIWLDDSLLTICVEGISVEKTTLPLNTLLIPSTSLSSFEIKSSRCW